MYGCRSGLRAKERTLRTSLRTENSLIQIYFIIVPVTQIGRRDRVHGDGSDTIARDAGGPRAAAAPSCALLRAASRARSPKQWADAASPAIAVHWIPAY